MIPPAAAATPTMSTAVAAPRQDEAAPDPVAVARAARREVVDVLAAAVWTLLVTGRAGQADEPTRSGTPVGPPQVRRCT